MLVYDKSSGYLGYSLAGAAADPLNEGSFATSAGQMRFSHGTWQHYTLVFTLNGQFYTYINGVSVSAGSISTPAPMQRSACYLGGKTNVFGGGDTAASPASPWFEGQVAGLAFFDGRALSEAEVFLLAGGDSASNLLAASYVGFPLLHSSIASSAGFSTNFPNKLVRNQWPQSDFAPSFFNPNAKIGADLNNRTQTNSDRSFLFLPLFGDPAWSSQIWFQSDSGVKTNSATLPPDTSGPALPPATPVALTTTTTAAEPIGNPATPASLTVGTTVAAAAVSTIVPQTLFSLNNSLNSAGSMLLSIRNVAGFASPQLVFDFSATVNAADGSSSSLPMTAVIAEADTDLHHLVIVYKAAENTAAWIQAGFPCILS